MRREYSVHEHIRVAAYRGGKVRVVGKREPEVPDVFGRVDCLCHAPQRCRADKRSLRLSFYLFKQTLDVFCTIRAFLLIKLIADGAYKGRQLLDAVGFRLVVDAVEEDHVAAGHFGGKFGYVGRDLAVSQEHKLFDEPVGIDAGFAGDTKRLAAFVQLKTHFVVAEVYSAFLRALFAHYSREFAKRNQLG